METEATPLREDIAPVPERRPFPKWDSSKPDCDNTLDWLLVYAENTDDLAFWCASEIIRMDLKQFNAERDYLKLQIRMAQLAMVVAVLIMATAIGAVTLIGMLAGHVKPF